MLTDLSYAISGLLLESIATITTTATAIAPVGVARTRWELGTGSVYEVEVC